MRLPQIEFDPKISFGNLLTIAGGVVVLIIGWTTMQSDIRAEREARVAMLARLDRLEVKDEIMLKQFNDGQSATIGALAGLKAQVEALIRQVERRNNQP